MKETKAKQAKVTPQIHKAKATATKAVAGKQSPAPVYKKPQVQAPKSIPIQPTKKQSVNVISTKAPAITKKSTYVCNKTDNQKVTNNRNEFPTSFPFWARLKISKNRTTLVIDEELVINKKTKKQEDGFVHREATHTKNKNYEKVVPNPDKTDNEPMYLKRPQKLPNKLFEPHNKDLDMPDNLKSRYDKNNKK